MLRVNKVVKPEVVKPEIQEPEVVKPEIQEPEVVEPGSFIPCSESIIQCIDIIGSRQHSCVFAQHLL